jgi:hypothetical protein
MLRRESNCWSLEVFYSFAGSVVWRTRITPGCSTHGGRQVPGSAHLPKQRSGGRAGGQPAHTRIPFRSRNLDWSVRPVPRKTGFSVTVCCGCPWWSW